MTYKHNIFYMIGRYKYMIVGHALRNAVASVWIQIFRTFAELGQYNT